MRESESERRREGREVKGGEIGCGDEMGGWSELA
jgi:hypothetical protein